MKKSKYMLWFMILGTFLLTACGEDEKEEGIGIVSSHSTEQYFEEITSAIDIMTE